MTDTKDTAILIFLGGLVLGSFVAAWSGSVVAGGVVWILGGLLASYVWSTE